MNIYERLGIRHIINAADSYTIIGGSVMPPKVVEAMSEAAQSFVVIEHLHDAVGQTLAQLTRNEAAMVTSGAAAALAITTAACITGTNEDMITKAPLSGVVKNEVIIHSCQNNGFIHAVNQTGASVVWLDDRYEGSLMQLESMISERTACFIYFTTEQYERDAIPLEDVIDVCNRRGVPVVVDAAAQLPPVSNLWTYTEMGADLVIFSGGKTLRGPQSTGLVVGKTELVRACRMNSSPNVAIGRPMKVGKEEMIGLLAAVERYVNLDHDLESAKLEHMIDLIRSEASRLGLQAERIFPGPTGQSYARAVIHINPETGVTAALLKAELQEGNPSIWVNTTSDEKAIIVNPLHLRKDEIGVIFNRIEKIVRRGD